MKENDCPHPAEGLVINEVGGISGAGQSLFVELLGPPSASLHGLFVVLFESGGASHAVPLKGYFGEDGFFLLRNESAAGECVRYFEFLSDCV